MDLLDDRLIRARASGAVFARSVARPPWGLTLPGSIQLSLHTVLRGHLWLWLDDRAQTVRLLPADLALGGGGRDHHIPHKPGLDLSCCVRPQLRTCARPVADAVPDRLAAHAGSRLSTGRRAHLGTDRRTHRLQLTQRVRGDIPPARWIGTRSMAPAVLVKATTGGAGIASAVALALMGTGGVPTRSTAGGARWRARSR